MRCLLPLLLLTAPVAVAQGLPLALALQQAAPPDTSRAFRWADDTWWGYDKAQHFGASVFATLSSQYVLVNKGGLRERQAAPGAAAAALGLGLAKEVYDVRRPYGTGFSYRDLAWDAAGVGAALVLILL